MPYARLGKAKNLTITSIEGNEKGRSKVVSVSVVHPRDNIFERHRLAHGRFLFQLFFMMTVVVVQLGTKTKTARTTNRKKDPILVLRFGETKPKATTMVTTKTASTTMCPIPRASRKPVQVFHNPKLARVKKSCRLRSRL